MRPRISRPRSLRARIALSAGLVAAVVFAAASWEMRHVAYDQQMSEADADARQQADLIVASTTRTSWPKGDQWGRFPFEVVSSGGGLVASSSQLTAFEAGRKAFMPLPPAGLVPDQPYWGSSTARFPPTGAGQNSPLAGTSVTAITATESVSLLPAGTLSPGDDVAPNAPSGAYLRVYIFVTTTSAQAAVGALDRVLYPAVPGGVLLVMAVAYLAARRALRPVEEIRIRTAAVTAADPRERVTVPPTGDEIARLATTINTTLARLDDAARAQRRFVADAAHELRSPLASLLATLDVAGAYPESTDWPEAVAAAAHQARRIQELADDLLLLARLDAAPTPLDHRLDLAVLAHDVAADFAARRADVSVLDETDGRAVVVGNPLQLERMLRNLVENATRHASALIEVSAAVEGLNVILSVQDDGPGIPHEERERVFERFTRLDDDRSRATGGSGLGLAIAREIAERHHGTLRVEDAPKGARLVARLPLAGVKR